MQEMVQRQLISSRGEIEVPLAGIEELAAGTARPKEV
jgi:hypothetical protein